MMALLSRSMTDHFREEEALMTRSGYPGCSNIGPTIRPFSLDSRA